MIVFIVPVCAWAGWPWIAADLSATRPPPPSHPRAGRPRPHRRLPHQPLQDPVLYPAHRSLQVFGGQCRQISTCWYREAWLGHLAWKDFELRCGSTKITRTIVNFLLEWYRMGCGLFTGGREGELVSVGSNPASPKTTTWKVLIYCYAVLLKLMEARAALILLSSWIQKIRSSQNYGMYWSDAASWAWSCKGALKKKWEFEEKL
jgi:hypothetical protein